MNLNFTYQEEVIKVMPTPIYFQQIPDITASLRHSNILI